MVIKTLDSELDPDPHLPKKLIRIKPMRIDNTENFLFTTKVLTMIRFVILLYDKNQRIQNNFSTEISCGKTKIQAQEASNGQH